MADPGREQSARAAELSFDDIDVGETFEFVRTITEADINDFALLSGDYSPLHVDAEYAESTEFGQRVVHGMLLASLFSNLVGMRVPGKPALYLAQDLAFRAPAFIGDSVTVRAKVTAKSEATSTLSLATEIRNADGKILVSGTGRVKIRGDMPGTSRSVREEVHPRSETGTEAPVAIVTGGVRGIGGAIARKLASDGYAVLSAYRANEQAARSFVDGVEAEGGQCRALRADVTREEDVARLIEAASDLGGAVKILINAAIGDLVPVPAIDLGWSQFQDHLDTQVKSVLRMCQNVYPPMREAGGGSIVNVLSQVVHNAPPKGMAHYTTAKYALMGLSKALAAEWAPENIRVNMISPGLAKTELTQHYHDRVFKMEAAKTPLGRLVEVQDIAESVSYLTSERARFITGTNIFLTGGQDMP